MTKLALILSTLAFIISGYSIFKPEGKVESFNVVKTVKAFEAQLIKDKLSDSQSKRIYQKFNQALADAESSYAETHHVALIVTQASVANIHDATNDIQLLIQEKMAGK